MGPVASIDDPITKVIGGVIVLPAGHVMVRFKKQPLDTTTHKAKSCYTCRECTNLCPRNAMGHAIYPSKIMSYSWYIDEILRMIESGDIDPAIRVMISEAMLCCQCGVCEQVACSFDLSPNRIYALIRDAALKAAMKFDFTGRTSDDSLFDFRKVPTLTYAKKMDLDRYLVNTEYEPFGTYLPGMVTIPLQQHIGAPSVPSVKTDDTVAAGDLIGTIPEGALGAAVHASVDGKIEEITDSYIVIRRTGS
jgi:Na+-translocating ferredoxin:NAD+ oxidoreductase RnfC subunit